jgi:membrane-bound lytic murein transglycosylase A
MPPFQSVPAILLSLWLTGCGLMPAMTPTTAPEGRPAAPPPTAPATLPSHPAGDLPPVVPPAATTPRPAVPPPVAPPAAEPAKPLAMSWIRAVSFADLPGWRQDDLTLAWPALLQSCRGLRSQPLWNKACEAASQLALPDTDTARGYFERHFLPYQVLQPDGLDEGLVTGYYEPQLSGSRYPP